MQVNCYPTAITEVSVYELVIRAEKIASHSIALAEEIAIHYNIVWRGWGEQAVGLVGYQE